VRRSSASTVLLLALPIFILSLFVVVLIWTGACEASNPTQRKICGAKHNGGALATLVVPSALFLLVGFAQSSSRRLYGAFGAIVGLLILIGGTYMVTYP